MLTLALAVAPLATSTPIQEPSVLLLGVAGPEVAYARTAILHVKVLNPAGVALDFIQCGCPGAEFSYGWWSAPSDQQPSISADWWTRSHGSVMSDGGHWAINVLPPGEYYFAETDRDYAYNPTSSPTTFANADLEVTTLFVTETTPEVPVLYGNEPTAAVPPFVHTDGDWVTGDFIGAFEYSVGVGDTPSFVSTPIAMGKQGIHAPSLTPAYWAPQVAENSVGESFGIYASNHWFHWSDPEFNAVHFVAYSFQSGTQKTEIVPNVYLRLASVDVLHVMDDLWGSHPADIIPLPNNPVLVGVHVYWQTFLNWTPDGTGTTPVWDTHAAMTSTLR